MANDLTFIYQLTCDSIDNVGGFNAEKFYESDRLGDPVDLCLLNLRHFKLYNLQLDST